MFIFLTNILIFVLRLHLFSCCIKSCSLWLYFLCIL